jgi:hypothetical protein
MVAAEPPRRAGSGRSARSRGSRRTGSSSSPHSCPTARRLTKSEPEPEALLVCIPLCATQPYQRARGRELLQSTPTPTCHSPYRFLSCLPGAGRGSFSARASGRSPLLPGANPRVCSCGAAAPGPLHAQGWLTARALPCVRSTAMPIWTTATARRRATRRRSTSMGAQWTGCARSSPPHATSSRACGRWPSSLCFSRFLSSLS